MKAQENMKEPCLIDGCINMGKRRGVCSNHYRAMEVLVREGTITWKGLSAKGMIRKRRKGIGIGSPRRTDEAARDPEG
jgi:hypothetical protein